MENQIVAFITSDTISANLVVSLLRENGIESNILSKKDSSFKIFGSIEVYVNAEDHAKANGIIETSGIK
jgi:type III secretory pathway lipoprotein EscJ